MRARVATLASDGWALIDVEAAYRARDGVYWVPPVEARRGIRRGMLAQLLFAWADPGPDDPGRERMWIEVERVEPDGSFAGTLANEPIAVAPISEGEWIVARPEHVLDVVPERGARRLSEESDLVVCRGHGWSEPCYVCEHVAHGDGLGFHEADDPSTLRPNAWCDACDAVVMAAGGSWERAEREPKIVLACGGCYDRYRERNRRG
jgi:hypothetical protein